MKERNSKQSILLFLKGVAMGAADVVPGVSGGTIAFISGIYEELIETIDKLNLSFFKLWKEEGFKATWKYHNLTFLTILVSGILLSILSFAKIIGWLLENEPIIVWSFFFGLILASIHYIGKQISPWNFRIVLAILLATAISYYITLMEPVASPESNWYIFISGFIAIIAMILPGISGSFILLLLGSYQVIIGTLNQFSLSITTLDWQLFSTSVLRLLSFAIGAIIGIKLFSKILNWLFKNYKNTTLAILTGFMIGALNKIWPWKEVLSWRANSAGDQVPFLERSILPTNFDGDPQIINAIIFAILGFLSIFILEYIARKKVKTE